MFLDSDDLRHPLRHGPPGGDVDVGPPSAGVEITAPKWPFAKRSVTCTQPTRRSTVYGPTPVDQTTHRATRPQDSALAEARYAGGLDIGGTIYDYVAGSRERND